VLLQKRGKVVDTSVEPHPAFCFAGMSGELGCADYAGRSGGDGGGGGGARRGREG